MKYFLVLLLLVVPAQEKTIEQCNEMIQTAIAAMHNKEHAHSLELLTEAQTLAREKGWKRELFLAINNIGANYYKMSDYGEALKNYLEAYDIAIQHLDANQEMVVLNNIGILFYQEDKLDESEAHFYKAYRIAEDFNDTFKMGLYAVNLGLVLNKSGRLDEAHAYLEIAIPLLQNNQNVLLQAKYGVGENLYLKGDYVASEAYLLRLLPELGELEFLDHKTSLLLILSKIADDSNDYSKAIAYANSARHPNNGLEAQIDINTRLAELYYQNNDYQKAWQYRDSLLLLKDSLFGVKSMEQFESNRVKLDIIKYEKELDENNKRFMAERRLFYFLLGGALLLLLFLIWIWRNSVIKLKQKKIIADRNQKIKMLELEQELETRNRKLAVKALNMSSRNELLKDIIENIKNQPDLAGKPELLKYVTQLNRHIKNEAQWDDFFTHFEEANHGFLKALKTKHPKLLSNDIRFLSYVYMNLSIKEMASLLNITTDACRKRKERIGKKMGLQETAELYDYLSRL
mgnify:CR=1 FL=1